MDFEQAEKKFKQLKMEFAAGKLTEIEFKTQLEELMLQDEEGNWWMIGYETERWHRHDGTNWVQVDQPGVLVQESTPREQKDVKTAKKSEAEKDRLEKEKKIAEKPALQITEHEQLDRKKAEREAVEKKAKEQVARLKVGLEARKNAIFEAAEKVKHNVAESFRKKPTQSYKVFFIIAIFTVIGYSGSRWYSAAQIASATSTAFANATSTERANSASTERANITSTANADTVSTARVNATSTARAEAIVQATANAKATVTARAEANVQATANAKASVTARAKANAQATQDARYFLDGFINNSNKWKTGFIGNEDVYSSFASISDGVFIWDVTEVKKKFVAYQSMPGEKWVEDFLLSVDAKNASDNLDLCYGLSFRTNGLFSYWFTVCDSQRYRIGIGDDSGGRGLSGWTDSSEIKPDDWNQIKVIASGSQFEFYINNVQVEQITDTALTSGTLGVAFEASREEPGQIWFDNFHLEIK